MLHLARGPGAALLTTPLLAVRAAGPADEFIVAAMPEAYRSSHTLRPAKRRTLVSGTMSEKNLQLHVFLLLCTFARVAAGAFFFFFV